MSEAKSWDKYRLLLPVAYAVAVFYGGVIDIGELPQTPFVASDKLLHAAAFGGLEVVLEWAFYNREAKARRVLAILGSSGVGGALELVQAALPYRSADFWDFFADSVGALLAAFGVWLLLRAVRTPSGEPS